MLENTPAKGRSQTNANSIRNYLRAPLSDITQRTSQNVQSSSLQPHNSSLFDPASPTPAPLKKRTKYVDLWSNILASKENVRKSNVEKGRGNLLAATKGQPSVRQYFDCTNLQALSRRELWGTSSGKLNGSKRWCASTKFYIKDFMSYDTDVYKFMGQCGYITPFVCAFSHSARGGKYMAVGDEEGGIGFIDSRKDNRIELESARNQFVAHDNAIFDLQWSRDDSTIISASGDQTARLWDVERQMCKAVLRGHSCSIKAVAYNHKDNNVWATASRDGNIFIWDVRTSGSADKAGARHVRPIVGIISAHGQQNNLKSVTKTKTRSSVPAVPIRSNPTSSVTGVQWLRHFDYLLASSGALDGIIKYWDIRKLSPHKGTPEPLTMSVDGSTSKRPHGVSTLLLDHTGTRLFANSTDNHIYMYDAIRLGPPLSRFTHPNYRCSSFYVRMSISPDGRFLVSGSSDKRMYIWEMDAPGEKPVVLKGHENEVSSVSWCKTDLGLLASVSDDTNLRLWRVQQSMSEQCRQNPNLLDQHWGIVVDS